MSKKSGSVKVRINLAEASFEFISVECPSREYAAAWLRYAAHVIDGKEVCEKPEPMLFCKEREPKKCRAR